MTQTTELTRHRLSNPFGQAMRSDREELERSMMEYGYDTRHPIILYEGDVLDGWHRYLAAVRTRVEPSTEHFEGSEDEARALVYRENMARRQMSQKQKATALLLLNMWVSSAEQLTIAEIQGRCGMKSQKALLQLKKLVEHNPDLAQEVARGEAAADTAIRQLGEEPVEGREGTGGGSREVIFTLKKRELIERAHKARLSSGLTKQGFLNKSVELFIDWAESGSNAPAEAA